MFLRFIQSSLTNGVVLRNLVHEGKIGTKECAVAFAKHYLAKAKVSKLHESVTV